MLDLEASGGLGRQRGELRFLDLQGSAKTSPRRHEGHEGHEGPIKIVTEPAQQTKRQ
jgi:hypothetical protein